MWYGRYTLIRDRTLLVAMRINAKQIERARTEGRTSFYFSLQHQSVWGEPKSPYAHDFVCTMNWKYVFNREDITPENKAELDKHWLEIYTETYTTYMSDRMTPKTEQQLDQKRQDNETLIKFMDDFMALL